MKIGQPEPVTEEAAVAEKKAAEVAAASGGV